MTLFNMEFIIWGLLIKVNGELSPLRFFVSNKCTKENLLQEKKLFIFMIE